MTDALIWDKIGEEELTELNGGEADLMDHFYDDLAKGCTGWYSAASKKNAADVEDMKATVENLGAHKHIIMNYAREEFHTVKGSIFNIVDSLIDSQRRIASVDDYFTGRIRYMTKRIDADQWKYQLKYSTGLTKRCASEADDVAAFSKTVVSNSQAIAKKMSTVGAKFLQGAKRDLNAWDCEAMYPKP